MPIRDGCTKESKKRSTATGHAESEEDAMRPRHDKRGTATEHAKKRNASSSASKGGGKGDRRVKAKVEAHDYDSQGYGDRVVKPSSTFHPHSCSKESQKRGTATEHAKQLQRGTATEHAKQRPSMTWGYNSQTQLDMEEAQADRANHTLEHLVFNLGEFLTHLLRELCCSPRLEADCEDIVFEKIAKWAWTQAGRHFYGESELLLNKKMWDIMTRDKDGLPKEHSFADWCRRITIHSTRSTGASSAATKHTERENPFRKLAEDILTHELTPEQMDNPVYSLRRGKNISTPQRSLINLLLRKNLGDARVAYYIFEHGVPTLLDPPLQRAPPKRALLENMLEDFMTWHASLLQWLLEQQQHPNTITARRLSDLDQKQWQTERRRQKEEARQRVSQGARLATLRDIGKKKYDDMSATEQQILEDFDCNKSQRQHENRRVQKPEHFRRKML